MITIFTLVVHDRCNFKLISLAYVMVEVTGVVVQRSVFLAGETVYCEVKFLNQGDGPCSCEPKNGMVNTNHKSMENCCKHVSRHLAWASAQIHCQCLVNESKVRVPANRLDQESVASLSTSFMPWQGEKGFCYLSTNPKILFCNLNLEYGQSKTFLYSEKIPNHAPPSYPGQLVKFAYKVSIGIGRVHMPTCLLKLPIRVLDFKEAVGKIESPPLEPSQGNPFLEEEASTNQSFLDVFSECVSSVTCRRNNNTYNIWSTYGSVGKFSLPKLSYKIGEDIVGTFDFTHSAVKCVKYSASLKLEETVSRSFLQERQIGRNKPTVTLHGRTEECSCNSRISFFSVHIPLTATPGFTADMVTTQWKLHFEFTTLHLEDKTKSSNTLNAVPSEKNIVVDQCEVPDQLGVETMTWDLPLSIFSTNPDQIALASSWTPHVGIFLK